MGYAYQSALFLLPLNALPASDFPSSFQLDSELFCVSLLISVLTFDPA